MISVPLGLPTEKRWRWAPPDLILQGCFRFLREQDDRLTRRMETNEMAKKLYVGNLSWNIGTDELREIFAEHGEVQDAIVLADRETGRSRGFGFVEFASPEDANIAIEALNGQEVDGRQLRVNEAQERAPRGGGGGGRGGRGGGGGGGRDNRW